MAPIIFPCFKAKVFRPVRKAEHIVYKGPGVKSFRFGNQTVILKPIPPVKSRRFVAKKLMSPDMWREMLKKAPPKVQMKPKEKEKRAAMKEIVLKAEKTIKIANRESLEDYCKEYCKEGLPGKKHKPRKIKSKLHESALATAIIGAGKTPKPKKAPKKINFTVSMSRFEHYESEFTIGDPASMNSGPFAAYTFWVDGDGMVEMPEPSFDEIIVGATINIANDDEDSNMSEM